jgi:hypothetical protein
MGNTAPRPLLRSSPSQQRGIINRSYQTQADNIVGKMTMASLDEEMKAHETQPSERIKLIPISPHNPEKAYPRLTSNLRRRTPWFPFEQQCSAA